MAISIMEMSKTYKVMLFSEDIHTTVTNNGAAVSEWIGEIQERQCPIIVGLDVEWRPSFSSEQNPVATLQLCVRKYCLIYQMMHSNCIPESLSGFLSGSSHITFVGVGIKADLEKLQRDYGIGGGAYWMDLRRAAGMESASLSKLASVVLEMEVEKPRAVTMSRWDDRCLTPEQVQYASVDAYLSFQIGRSLGLDVV